MKSGRWIREPGQTRATTFKGCRGIQDRLVSRQLPIVRSRSLRLDQPYQSRPRCLGWTWATLSALQMEPINLRGPYWQTRVQRYPY
jgi:hypothetical protein